MHARVNEVAAGIVLTAVLLAGMASADEHDPLPDIERRWIPSFGPAAGITIQKMDASVSSRCANGGPVTFTDGIPPGEPIGVEETPECEGFPTPAESGALRPADSGSEITVTPYVGGVLQILSPTIPLFPGRPRAFLTAEAMALFSPTRNLAVEGDASEIGYPRSLNPEQRPQTTTNALTGRGSRTSSEFKTLGLGATLGLAFPIDVVGRRLWLKPLAGWYRYKVDVEGVVVGGFKVQCPFPTALQCAPLPQNNFREIQLSGSGSRTLNGIGPGLEAELETGRFGPIGTSLYLGLYSYRMLGKRRVEFEESLFYSPLLDSPFLPPCPFGNPDVCGPTDAVGGGPPLAEGGQPTGQGDDYSARWSWKAAPWLFRTGIGFRFHWIGFER